MPNARNGHHFGRCYLRGLLVSEMLTLPFATYAMYPSVPFFAGGRGREEVVAGLLAAAVLLGLAALVVINGLRQSVHRTT